MTRSRGDEMFIRKPNVTLAIVLATLIAAASAAAQNAPADAQKPDAAAGTQKPAAADTQKPATPAADARPLDVATVLKTVQQKIGTQLPTKVRIVAAGSGYAIKAADPKERGHYRIESYTQELDIAASKLTENVVREASGSSGTGAAAEARSPWSDPHALWTTPLGFLAGASSRPATIRSETLLNSPYRVIAFTPDGGAEVRGYITDDDVLERTRTQIGGVDVESVFMSWEKFGDITFPSLIIQKENGQLTRILVVKAVEPPGGAASKAEESNG